jgi:very-short-patch-repair endonuclease
VTTGNRPQVISESRVETAAWWAGQGIPRHVLLELVAAGDLVRTRRGVYATRAAAGEAAGGPRAEHAYRVKSAIAIAGEDAVACCSSAAKILGLALIEDPPPGTNADPDEETTTVTLLRPDARNRNRRPTKGIVYHAAALVPKGSREDLHVAVSHGVRVTSAPRTVVDLARQQDLIAGVATADSAFRNYGFYKEDYLRVLESCAGWRGLEKARQVIGFADEKSESPLESALRVRLQEWGFPPPELQVMLPVGPNYFRVDFLYRQERTVIEADGKGKMDSPEAYWKERERDQWLRDADFKVAHVSWKEVFHDPERVKTRIRKALAAPSPF